MWNALREKFVAETGSAGRRALARAVVAFCDGMSVKTFVGETQGHIANAPRGSREFYWDTVFVPDEIDGRPGTLTYAEIVDDPNMGLRHKVTRLSQSMKALVLFFEHYIAAARPTLWR
jgi:inosine/xanthosine triphosphate pyrophosphatase family protein